MGVLQSLQCTAMALRLARDLAASRGDPAMTIEFPDETAREHFKCLLRSEPEFIRTLPIAAANDLDENKITMAGIEIALSVAQRNCAYG